MKRIYDYSKLKEKMREHRYSQRTLAEAIGISKTSLNIKLNNKSEFSQEEILNLAKILGVPDRELNIYFFNVVARKTVQRQSA